MNDKEKEWTLTSSGILDSVIRAGQAPLPDPEKHRPKADSGTWRLGEQTVVKSKGEFYYGWSWWRPKGASDK